MTQPKFQGKYRVESTRLPNRNYAANGSYFITICTKNRDHDFGNVVSGQVHLSVIGEIAQRFWVDIPNHFDYTYIDAYVIMPNHVHGIVVIDRPENVETLQCNVSTQNDAPWDITQRQFMSNISPKPGSLGAIARSYKSVVTRWCRENGHNHFAWQSRFYDHIIRADGSLDRIREYIINNPTKWEEDKNNPANLWM
ncbi:transposase [Fischerella thermalis CCMEE 5198]|jgi:REP element-mobilizing transposase RayT|uniref:transposase n=1 Tax=Fischerella thermalis TaxID=372787 RepID=UPI000C7FAB13|nr:transposase [Fischerella thermalis]PMB06814.1 transposase [Fischerella thermalis CCMEE 5196]PMB22404.1 transposase [Fischerella thermalis CCMEE 5198]